MPSDPGGPAAVVAPPDPGAVLVDAVETAIKTALAPVVGRVRALETAAADGAALRERIAALEARPPVPGPPGPAGADGAPGKDGAPGVAGMTYRGVHVLGGAYAPGDCVTAAGSLWHCNVATSSRPGDGGPAWTLAVKRGRDATGR